MDDKMRMDRRTFACLGLLGVAAMGRGALAASPEPEALGAAADFKLGDTWMEARSGDIPVFFDNPDAEFQFLRVLGLANAGGAALGECITIVRELGPPTAAITPSFEKYFENYVAMARLWSPAWARLGAKVEAWAKQAAAQSSDVSARDAYLRATVYYRAAEFFTADPLAPEARALNEGGARCFRAAGKRFKGSFETISVPYGDKDLPGYFITPDKKKRRRPTIFMFTGFDGSAEEMFLWAGAAALEQGYNVAVIDGPGHRGALYRHPELTFRPDYDVPVRAMVDYLAERGEVDKKRIVLCSISFGGGLSARAAAALDDRLAAYITYPPMIDNAEAFAEVISPEVAQIRANPHSKFVTGASTLGELVDVMSAYNFRADAKRITTPTLVLLSDGEGPMYERHAREFYDDLAGPKHIHKFTVSEGAAMHCSFNNLPRLHQVMFGWLNETLNDRM
ncbi:MAG: alpha/beta fold hydrolase [Sphingomonadales bacterium]|nr:alpha/beta fold hydrolase [Sphingomonadales bacterium]